MGRARQYTEAGIRRVPCIKCKSPSRYQWRFCADGNWHGVCVECDIELNAIAMRWAFGNAREADIIKYASVARGSS